jgi:hypothetical protein
MFKKGPTDQELIQQQVKNFCDALLAKDIDKAMASVSDGFYHPEVGDKAAARDLLKQGVESGFVQDGKIDLSKMEIKIDKGVATVYPILASAAAGSVTVEMKLKKEKAGWFITEVNPEGV